MRMRKIFSSISDLEERAFCEGYMYAQREFANQLSNNALAERLNRNEYEREMEKRKKKRTGGHVMGALGTVGMLTHAGIDPVIKEAEKEGLEKLGNRLAKAILNSNISSFFVPGRADKLAKIREKGIKNIKGWAKANRGLGLGAAALTAGGLYRINKKANKNMTYEDWLAEKDGQNED